MRGFVVIAGDLEAACTKAIDSTARSAPGGFEWSRSHQGKDLAVYVRGPCPPAVQATPLGDLVVIGDLFDGHGRPCAPDPDMAGLGDDQVFRRLSRETWGRYVALVRRGGDWSALRDPSGALDCFSWRRDGLTFFTNDLPAWLAPFLPNELAIDEDRLALMMAAPTVMLGGSALKGVAALAPGAMVRAGDTRQIWRPATLPNQGLVRSDAAGETLRAAVRLATTTLGRLPGSAVVEVSGGLDSAIVAGWLGEDRRADVVRWLNLYIDEPLADERAYAATVADRLGVQLTTAEKAEGQIAVAGAEAAALALRPPVGAVDDVYDKLIGTLAAGTGATRLYSGQGGDTVFLQVAPAGLSRDLLLDKGLSGLLSSRIVDLARWTRRSVWSHLAEAFRPRSGGVAYGIRPMAFAADAVRDLSVAAAPHPWLDGIEELTPAKRFQVHSLALMQRLVGPSQRAECVDCLYPLLAQPVIEASLRTSAIDLTRGGRDRGLARQVFADIVPQAILDRRSKGDGTAYFSRLLERSLPSLRTLLLDGELARRGLIDRERLEAMLTPDYLVVDGLYPEFLDAAVIEMWLQAWLAWLSGRSVPAARSASLQGRR